MTLSWQRVATGARGWQVSGSGLLGSFDTSPGEHKAPVLGIKLVISRPSRQHRVGVRSVWQVHDEGGSS